MKTKSKQDKIREYTEAITKVVFVILMIASYLVHDTDMLITIGIIYLAMVFGDIKEMMETIQPPCRDDNNNKCMWEKYK